MAVGGGGRDASPAMARAASGACLRADVCASSALQGAWLKGPAGRRRAPLDLCVRADVLNCASNIERVSWTSDMSIQSIDSLRTAQRRGSQLVANASFYARRTHMSSGEWQGCRHNKAETLARALLQPTTTKAPGAGRGRPRDSKRVGRNKSLRVPKNLSLA